ncbi:hypothetical protein OIU76_020315 [Salix suchowensis]|nr:hypothetical protein OIU76_020315 [Salix suchowensis]
MLVEKIIPPSKTNSGILLPEPGKVAGFLFRIVMVTPEPKDPFKGVDWKGHRQIPDYYFLPRLPLPTSIAFYGACIAGGVGAGMLLEMWINKKVKEDGGIIWEFDK